MFQKKILLYLGHMLGNRQKFWQWFPDSFHLQRLSLELRVLPQGIPGKTGLPLIRVELCQRCLCSTSASLGCGIGCSRGRLEFETLADESGKRGSALGQVVWRLQGHGPCQVRTAHPADPSSDHLFLNMQSSRIWTKTKHKMFLPKRKRTLARFKSWGVWGAQWHVFSSPSGLKEMDPGCWPAPQGRLDA